MAIIVRIPTMLRSYVRNRADVKANGTTIGEVIADLEVRYPGIKERLCDQVGIHKAMSIFLNGEDVRFLQGLDTPVKDGDEISIVAALGGG